VEALVQKERQDETQFATKILMVFWVSSPVEMLMYFCAGFFWESHPVYDQTQGSGAVFFLTLRITLIYCQKKKNKLEVWKICVYGGFQLLEVREKQNVKNPRFIW
jgi:hypothetical protein